VKLTEPASLPADDDLMRVMKKQAFALIESIAGDTTTTSMDEAIDKWRVNLSKPTLSSRELFQIYSEAKHLEGYLNR
jgi:hypothetical protein